MWWVLKAKDGKYLSYQSFASFGGLEDAAVYRSEENAKKKAKSLAKNMAMWGDAGVYKDLEPVQIEVKEKASC